MIMMFIMDVYLQLLEYLIFVEDVFEYFYIFVQNFVGFFS